MEDETTTLLDKISLRKTPARVELLALFLKSSKAFSLSDIEELVGNNYDRSTIFRTLEVLAKHLILEKFIDKKGVNVYIFHHNHTNCSHNNHFHFKCENCQNITALPDLPENYMAVLGKHNVKSLNLMIEGTCENCQLS
jgi:Fur family transcriptional regulator, ferric uptake regulator